MWTRCYLVVSIFAFYFFSLTKCSIVYETKTIYIERENVNVDYKQKKKKLKNKKIVYMRQRERESMKQTGG